MHFTKKNISEKRLDFVKKLQSKKLLRFPGAYNPLCAKLIAEIGFDGVYISGGVMSKKDYLKKIEAGANLVQVYTGFIYEGPQLIDDIINK